MGKNPFQPIHSQSHKITLCVISSRELLWRIWKAIDDDRTQTQRCIAHLIHKAHIHTAERKREGKLDSMLVTRHRLSRSKKKSKLFFFSRNDHFWFFLMICQLCMYTNRQFLNWAIAEQTRGENARDKSFRIRVTEPPLLLRTIQHNIDSISGKRQCFSFLFFASFRLSATIYLFTSIQIDWVFCRFGWSV